MEFDKNRVYTALNADELKVGSKVIVADYLELLTAQVKDNSYPIYIGELSCIMGTSSTNRFKVGDKTYNLAYLISEPEEKKLKWTDLKIGDVIRLIGTNRKVQVIGTYEDADDYHIYTCGSWMSDAELEEWEKVEE